ncbi:g-patch domain protein [Oesophagostomum dentatum]|uniref:G-patch domain protein n=1 Tax=Oesophagostomum dentatum TaxID=61180 RepID=A0A0B1SRT6_OESDE|nr:g-patch domain protein [Oesophagostomum dentatum]
MKMLRMSEIWVVNIVSDQLEYMHYAGLSGMSLLAEPRRKQKLSIDPRNLQWKNDHDKFSQKLMEKMGWSEGEGLGRNLQGNADHVKLKANYTGRGLGADKLASYDSTWIGHHDDFADLLNALNKNKLQKATTEEEKEERAKKISLELASKSIRRRIHYQKFARAKDTSNYSENDRTAVLGIGLHRAKTESPQKEEPEEESPKKEQEPEDLPKSNTTVSTLSVSEYFAAKMAALKAKREQAGPETAANSNVKLEETSTIKEEFEQVVETEEDRKERKKKRKEAKRLRQSIQCDTPTDLDYRALSPDLFENCKEIGLEASPKKAKMELDSSEENVVEESTVKKEKRKKDKRVEEEEDRSHINEIVEVKKKKKKSKKNRREDE